MLILITYDVETVSSNGKKRLRQVAKQCMNYGQRVQNSVFDCVIDAAQFVELKHRLENIINYEKDSIRYYFLGSNWQNKVEHIGVKTSYNPEGIICI